MKDITHNYNKYLNEKCGRHGYAPWKKKEIVQPNSKQYGEFLAVKKRQGK